LRRIVSITAARTNTERTNTVVIYIRQIIEIINHIADVRHAHRRAFQKTWFATAFALMASIISHRHKTRFGKFARIKPGGLFFYAAARMNHYNGGVLFGFIEIFRDKKHARQFNAVTWDLDTLLHIKLLPNVLYG